MVYVWIMCYLRKCFVPCYHKEEASHGRETAEMNAPSSDAATEGEAVSQSEGYTVPSGSNANGNEQVYRPFIMYICAIFTPPHERNML